MGKGKNTKPKVSENSIYMTSVYTSVFFVIEHTVNCFMLHFSQFFSEGQTLFIVLSELHFFSEQ